MPMIFEYRVMGLLVRPYNKKAPDRGPWNLEASIQGLTFTDPARQSDGRVSSGNNRLE